VPRTLSEEAIGAFRERLIDAAERLFAASGPGAVTMRELAAAVGVSPMTPYRYFPDKSAILAAVRARAFNRHADALEAARERAGPDLAAASRAVGRAYLDFALAHPEAYRLMFDIRQPDEEAYPELVAAGMRSHRTMTRHLEALADAGILQGDPGLIGRMFWAALHGPIMLSFSRMLPDDGYGVRDVAEALLETLAGAVFVPAPQP